METIQGIIENVTSKNGESNGRQWTLTIYTIKGKKYSTFRNLEFEEGDKVSLAYEVNEDGQKEYNNIKSGTLMEKGNPKPAVETVHKYSNGNEGAEFGLACNLGLRKTLSEGLGENTFEEAYKMNVKMLFRWNKELRNELVK